jgi:3-hydroxyisobutyrate dehydrogenase-like beta-hydroxyacid dehydrogenase
VSKVSVIGLGAMGSALARALLRDGYEVTVWNRTSAKAEPLVREGATLAPDPASAVEASPVVLVCVTNYEATRDILSGRDVTAHLPGRVLVQFSAGTPEEAREMEHWAQGSEAEYLDGDIEVYPKQIGAAEAGILVAGAEESFQRCEPIFRSLGGGTSYVGEAIGTANTLGMAMGSIMFGVLLSALHSARICEVEGLHVDEFTGMVAEFMVTVGGAVQDLGERIQEERYSEPQSSLQTYADGAEQLLKQAHESQIDSDFPAYASKTLQKGMDAGLGNEDLAALIKVLRADAQPQLTK